MAFKTQVKYAAHPYLWMSKAKARSTGLGMVSEGKELTTEELPEIESEHVKIYPMVSKKKKEFIRIESILLINILNYYSCGRTL